MNRSLEEGISLVATVGGVYNTWQAPQHRTIRRLAASVLSAVSNYHVPSWTQATATDKKNTIRVTERDQRRENKSENTKSGGRKRKGWENEVARNILTIWCRIWQREVVQQEDEGGLIESVKGKWAGASRQYRFIAIRVKRFATTFYNPCCR